LFTKKLRVNISLKHNITQATSEKKKKIKRIYDLLHYEHFFLIFKVTLHILSCFAQRINQHNAWHFQYNYVQIIS